jgi:uncharacterized protein (DUF362 family)
MGKRWQIDERNPEEESTMAKSVVSIVNGTNLDEMVEKALDYFGGVKAVIKSKSTVVIKPNAGHMGGPDSSMNTTPAVVTAVIKAARETNVIRKCG